MRFNPTNPVLSPRAAVAPAGPKKAAKKVAVRSESESRAPQGAPMAAATCRLAPLSDAMLAALLPCDAGNVAAIATARTAFAAFCAAHPQHGNVRAAWAAFHAELQVQLAVPVMPVAFTEPQPQPVPIMTTDHRPQTTDSPRPPAAAGSFQVEVIADNTGKWCGNGIRLATEAEARDYGADLHSRWLAVREWRVVPSVDAVNYTWTGSGLKAVEATPIPPIVTEPDPGESVESVSNIIPLVQPSTPPPALAPWRRYARPTA